MKEKPDSPLCPQLSSFCCFFSVRSGANFVGWFNFLLNALYIGSCVKSLASVRDAIDIYEDRLESDYIQYVYPALHKLKDIAGKCTDDRKLYQAMTSTMFTNKNDWREFLAKHESILSQCPILEYNYTLIEALDYIENSLMPQFYWSTSIPFLVLILAIFWLTVVETTSSIRLMKSTAYSFIAAIVIQIILQFAFIAHFHGKFKILFQKRVGHDQTGAPKLVLGDGIHWTLWFTFIIYSFFNVYAIPVIVTHVNNFERQLMDERILQQESKPTGDPEEFAVSYNRMGARNRSFRIEDDPMGDNFRQSLEDIRVGFRDTQPKTPSLSRVTSLTDEPIKEEEE